jgi:hypothetical protein
MTRGSYARSGPEQAVQYFAGVGTNPEQFAHLPFWVRGQHSLTVGRHLSAAMVKKNDAG